MSTLTDRLLAAKIRGTGNLIKVHGEQVQLFRPPAPIDNGQGGKKRAAGGDVKLSAVWRFYGGTTMQGRGVTTQPETYHITSTGQRVRIVGVLVGPVGDDMKEGDYFVKNGLRHEIIFVDPATLDFQTKGQVVVIG